MDLRQNIYALSDSALAGVIGAINALKADGGYDDFVRRHFLAGHAMHRGPAFLPWHRFLIREFEQALQLRVPGVTLPYWDWVADTAAPLSAPLWNTDPALGRIYIGGDGDPVNGDRVLTGPFAHWTALIAQGTQLVPRTPAGLIRRLGRDPQASGFPPFPTAAQDLQSQTVGTYDSFPWNATQSATPSFRNRLEGWLRDTEDEVGSQLHNRVHLWVGGDMLPHTSPNDPVFFLHHCNVDRQWARWQGTHPTVPYQPTSGGPSGHNLNDPLPQISTPGATAAGCLDYQTQLNYAYDTLV
jgi:tyrosinase